jgi:hypothetical protein
MININFFIAGVLALIVGILHSIIGERYFIPRLRLHEQVLDAGTEKYVNRTLRSAWHLATIASWSSASILLVFAYRTANETILLVVKVIALFYLVSGILSLFISHGRQPMWVIFLIMALFCWLGI